MSTPNAASGRGVSRELLTAGYFQALGYVVRRGVLLSVGGHTADATDIDVLAVRFSVPLLEERAIVDCRDRRKPQAFERVLWTRGLASFASATRAIVVTNRPPWQVREFASRGSVEILGADELGASRRALEGPALPFGDADESCAYQLGFSRSRAKYHARVLPETDAAVRSMLTGGHPLTNLNRVIQHLSSIGKGPTHALPDIEWLRRYVCFDAAVVASIMLVRFACECKWTPERDWVAYARKKLIYGDTPPRKAVELARLAMDRDFTDGLPAPAYIDELLAVIGQLLADQATAAAVPYVLDYHLLGHVLGEVPAETPVPAIGERQVEALRVAKRVLSALAYAAEVPPALWEQDPRGLPRVAAKELHGKGDARIVVADTGETPCMALPGEAPRATGGLHSEAAVPSGEADGPATPEPPTRDMPGDSETDG